MKLYADVSVDEYYSREPDEDDSWDIGDRAIVSMDVHLERNDKAGEEVTLAPDGTVCVLVEHYSDGCTFGTAEYAEVKGIFTTEDDARAWAVDQDTDHGYFGSHIEWVYRTMEAPL